MAHKKGQGSSRNGRDSNGQRRGVKKYGGQTVVAGKHHRPPSRQPVPRRRNVGQGNDYTLFALKDGVVSFDTGKNRRVHVIPAAAQG